jgi:hypothetical protein
VAATYFGKWNRICKRELGFDGDQEDLSFFLNFPEQASGDFGSPFLIIHKEKEPKKPVFQKAPAQ